MKYINIPAIRGVLGDIVYYISAFTFKEISELVRPINDELHTSTSLKDQIQRSLTENHKSITSYILSQKEHFFNALVLAVYDGEPEWNELEIGFKNVDYYNMGFLRLTGDEKIFPVDGQHRVEGIKSAIKEKPELEHETIAVIFIGHKKSKDGMEKTRRIFSTLNRYAKPVSIGDIIALDEDDTVAIVTRNLLETYPLFINDRIGTAKKSKALSNSDMTSFTSLITLYETNRLIYSYYIATKNERRRLFSKTTIGEKLKFRPEQIEIDSFEKHLTQFWDLFCRYFPKMQDYIESTNDNPAKEYRNNENGGLMYFRPVALPQLVKAILETSFRQVISIEKSISFYAKIEMCISKSPWEKILWDNDSHKMIIPNATIVHLILLYIYDPTILKANELINLKKRYAKILNIDIKDIELHLSSLKGDGNLNKAL